MTFENTAWLYISIGIIVFLLLITYTGSRKRKDLLKFFAAEKLLPKLLESYSPARRLFKNCLSITGISLIAIAIAGPQWGYDWEKVPSRGIDVLIAIDTSKSMLAEDIKPNRLERSKFAILDLLEELQSDRIGIIAFAGGAFLQCPLTLDHDAFRLTLENITTDIIPRGGTDIAVAIEEAEIAFDKNNAHKILILITDGEDLEEKGLAKAKEVSEDGVLIYTVGVGTAEGELIPITNEQGQSDFARDPNGNVVKTKLEESTLVKIAQATGGFYTPLGSTGAGLQQVYEAGLRTIPKEEREESLRKAAVLRYQWPLAIGCLLLALELIMSNRRFFRNKATMNSLILAATLLSVTTTNDLNAEKALSAQAKEMYDTANYEEAVNLYRRALVAEPENPELIYNLATSLYKIGELEEAESMMENNLNDADVVLQDEAFYNLGNIRYRRGRELMQEDPQKTVEFWENALTDYENAMELNPDDMDAEFNHELVSGQLEELKKMLEQQEQQDQNQSQDQEQNQDQNQEQEEQQNQDSQNQESDSSESQDQQSSGSDGNQDSNQADQNQNREQGEEDQGQQSSDSANMNEDGEGEDEEQNQAGQEGDEEQDGQEQTRGQESEEEGEDEGSQMTQSQEGEDGENPEEGQEGIPGAMSREEARQLLDSIKNSEKKLPATNYRLYKSNKKNRSLKDW